MNQESEFAVEVMRIASITEHPNADKLCILHLESALGPTGYPVVDRIGRHPGDLVVYVSVNSIVPLTGVEGERWGFLRERLDGAGKTHYRIRAARLRGVYSEGVVVDAPDGAALGDDLSLEWQIRQHIPPQSHMEVHGESNSVATPNWMKDAAPEFGVVSMKKAPWTFGRGDVVVATEKIHGTNFRFGWVRDNGLFGSGWFRRWRFILGSHRTWKSGRSTWWQRLLGIQPRGYYGENVWQTVAEEWNLAHRTRDHKGIIFYAEIYGTTSSGRRIQPEFDYGHQDLAFRVFDAMGQDGWAQWQQLVWWCADAELPMVPILYLGPWYEDIGELAEGESIAAHPRKQIREGVVIRTLEGDDRRRIGKHINPGYYLLKDMTGEG